MTIIWQNKNTKKYFGFSVSRVAEVKKKNYLCMSK